MKKMHSNTAGQVGERSEWRRDVGKGERQGEGSLTKWALEVIARTLAFILSAMGGPRAPPSQGGA